MSQLYKVVEDQPDGTEVVIEKDLTLAEAETLLCRMCNEGADAYLVDQEDDDKKVMVVGAVGSGFHFPAALRAALKAGIGMNDLVVVGDVRRRGKSVAAAEMQKLQAEMLMQEEVEIKSLRGEIHTFDVRRRNKSDRKRDRKNRWR